MGMTLIQVVDKLGEVKEQIKELTEIEETYKNKLKELFEAKKINNKIEGKNYVVTITEKTSPVIGQEKNKELHKRLKDDFYNVSKVTITNLKNYMGETEIENYITEYTSSLTVTTKRKNK